MLIHFIIFAALLIVNVLIDGLRWRKGDYITAGEHASRSTIRFIVFAYNAAYWIGFEPARSIEILALLVIQFAAFWIAFDPAVNVVALGPRKIFHLGETSPWDRVFWVVTGWRYRPAIILQYCCKAAAITAGIIWYNSITI